jgi:hypothetical protein
MVQKVIKMIVGVVAVALSLATTVVAGYKAVKNNTSEVLSDVQNSPIPTPVVNEVIEEIVEVEIIPTTPQTISNFENKPSPVATSNTSISPTPNSIHQSFVDDDDDEVEFEDDEDTEEEEEDGDEEDN